MGVFDSFYKPMRLTGKNIDPRYFKDNGDGTYSFTPFMMYVLSRDAADFAERRMKELDTDDKYTSVTMKTVSDTWGEKKHKAEWRAKYGKLTDEADARWYQYKSEHPDEFEVRTGSRIATGGEDENRFVNSYSPDILPGLDDAAAMWKLASECLEKYEKGGSERDTLPFETPTFSKAEFVDKHKALREQWSAELGIPEDTFVIEKWKEPRRQFRRNVKDKIAVTPSSEDFIKEYADGLIKHLTSSNAQEYKEKRDAYLQLVHGDFVQNFNDVSRNLKAEGAIERDNSGSIDIYTKMTEDVAPIKIITISKEDPKDATFNYILNITTDGENLHYTKKIAIVGDLIKALNTSIMLIEDVPSFSKYVDDLKRTLESLHA